MQIALLLFEHFTALDAIGPYEILSRVPRRPSSSPRRPGPSATTAAPSRSPPTAPGRRAEPRHRGRPRGPGQSAQMDNEARSAGCAPPTHTSTWTTSVCTGSLLLAAAGLLTGRRATSHWLAHDELDAVRRRTHGERVVTDGKYVTSAGVSSGIDMALTLTGRIAGDEYAQAVQLATEYDPQPPYDAGAPHKAPAHVVERLRSRSRFIVA